MPATNLHTIPEALPLPPDPPPYAIPEAPPLPPNSPPYHKYYRGHTFQSAAPVQKSRCACRFSKRTKLEIWLAPHKYSIMPKEMEDKMAFEMLHEPPQNALNASKTRLLDKPLVKMQIARVCEQFFKANLPQRRLAFNRVMQDLPETIAFVANKPIVDHLFEQLSMIMHRVFCQGTTDDSAYLKIYELLVRYYPHNQPSRGMVIDKAKNLHENSQWILNQAKCSFSTALISSIANYLGFIRVIPFCQNDRSKSIIAKQGSCLGFSLIYLCAAEAFEQNILQDGKLLSHAAAELQVRYEIVSHLANKLKTLVSQCGYRSKPVFSVESYEPNTLQRLAAQRYQQYQYKLAFSIAIKEEKLDAINAYLNHCDDDAKVKISNPIIQQQALTTYLLQHRYTLPQYARALASILHLDDKTTLTDIPSRKYIMSKLRQEIIAMKNDFFLTHLESYGLGLEKIQRLNLDELIVKMTKKGSRYLIILYEALSHSNPRAHALALNVDKSGMISLLDSNNAIYKSKQAYPLAYLFQAIAMVAYPELTNWCYAELPPKAQCLQILE